MFLDLQAGQAAVDIYDAFQPDPGPEADFWAGMFPTGGKIIVLPARTGELAAALAHRGLAVTAVDNSSRYLRVGARRHVPGAALHPGSRNTPPAGPGVGETDSGSSSPAGGSLELVPAEFSRLRLPAVSNRGGGPAPGTRQWDGAIVVREGFGLLEGATAIKNAARGLLAYLKPGAPLFVQFRPPPGEEPEPRGGPWLRSDFHGPVRPHLIPGWKVERAVEEWWSGRGRLRRVEVYRALPLRGGRSGRHGEDAPLPAVGNAPPQTWRHVEERFILSREHLSEALHDGGFRSIAPAAAAGGCFEDGEAASRTGTRDGLPFMFHPRLPGNFGPAAVLRAEAPHI